MLPVAALCLIGTTFLAKWLEAAYLKFKHKWKVVGSSPGTEHLFMLESMKFLSEYGSLVLVIPGNDGNINYSPEIMLKTGVKFNDK